MKEKLYCKNCGHDIDSHDDHVKINKTRLGYCDHCFDCIEKNNKEYEENKNSVGWNGAI